MLHVRIVLGNMVNTLLVHLLEIGDFCVVDGTAEQSVEVEVVLGKERQRVNLELLYRITTLHPGGGHGIDVEVEWTGAILVALLVPSEGADADLNRSVLFNDFFDLLVAVFRAVELGVLCFQPR